MYVQHLRRKALSVTCASERHLHWHACSPGSWALFFAVPCTIFWMFLGAIPSRCSECAQTEKHLLTTFPVPPNPHHNHHYCYLTPPSILGYAVVQDHTTHFSQTTQLTTGGWHKYTRTHKTHTHTTKQHGGHNRWCWLRECISEGGRRCILTRCYLSGY